MPAAVALETYAGMAETSDLKDVEVLKRLARLAVKPATAYLERVVFGECDTQMGRLAAARTFDPLRTLATGVNESDVDLLEQKYRFFKLGAFAPLPSKMKAEIPANRAAVAEIRPLTARLDADGKDTFDIEAFWRANEGGLPAWSAVLRAVLCHVPNSAPPERAFSILNDSIGDDQYNAKADYKKALIQVQYNGRRRDD